MHRFLRPELKELLPPEQLPGAVEAGRRLADAARRGRKIVIYGDYDVDGVTATAILWHGLTLAGANVGFYIPSRLDEGYGVNVEALEQIRAEGADLVITVDCGITAVEEARLARTLGLELIITDHHEPRGELPDAAVVVHPTACGSESANPYLSGAGVAFKVAWALARELCGSARVTAEYRDFLLDATAFAALGLVADVVPLTGENRVIASFGLRHLCHIDNPGLRALIEVSGLTGKRSYDEYDVGFVLAPRLNAVGRLGHARLAVELFTRADPERARQIASNLDAQNRQRQTVEQRIVKQAEALVVEQGFHRESKRGIVLASPDWHPGVIGIVASRLVDRFCRPTVLISLDGETGQGSGRSIPSFPLHEVLATCEQHLISHGGHAMAAGVRIAAGQIEAFVDAFLAQAARRLTPADLVPKLSLDDEVELGQLVPGVVEAILRMAPFGIGNPKPRLATGVVDLADEPRAVGNGGQHLQFTVRQGRTYRKAIAFGRGQRLRQLLDHRRLRLAFEPIINDWGGRRKVELKVIDWKWVE
jgi:single-stranded-DNA-specific exonuclease